MKKICAILMALILMAAAQTTALAEQGYELIKMLIENNGEGTSVLVDEEAYASLGNMVVIGFEFYSDSVILLGRNSDGKPEGTLWTIESDGTMLGMIAAYCAEWDTLAGWLEDGYSLMLTLQIGEDDDILRIENAEEAQMLHDVIMGS